MLYMCDFIPSLASLFTPDRVLYHESVHLYQASSVQLRLFKDYQELFFKESVHVS